METVDPSGLEGCAAFKCAYDLLNNSNNGLFCETIGLFDVNGLHNLNFEYGTYTQAGSEFTDYNSLTRTATIKIDKSQCDKPLLTAAAGILHESIHALLYLKLSEADLDPSNPQSYVNMWEDIFFDYYIETYGNDPNGVQHAVMVHDEYWVNKLAEALWNFNGQQFTIDHYKYTAWDGLRIYSHLWSDGTYGENSIFATLHQELMAGQTLTTCE